MIFYPNAEFQLSHNRIVYNNGVLMIVDRFSFEGKFSHFLSYGPIGLHTRAGNIQVGGFAFDQVSCTVKEFSDDISPIRFNWREGFGSHAVLREKSPFGYLDYHFSLEGNYLSLEATDSKTRVTWCKVDVPQAVGMAGVSA